MTAQPSPSRIAEVTILGPHPLLAVGIEPAPGANAAMHLHAGGQGVWVARSAATLGGHPVLCGFLGGEIGTVLGPMLEAMPGERCLVATAGDSGGYVMDRRTGPCDPVAQATGAAPSRHELDDLFAVTVTAALRSRLLVLCNPFPGDAIAPDFYRRLVVDLRPHGVRVVADLSSPRLDAALGGGLDVVKINDWELAEFVAGPVARPEQLAAAAARLQAAGAAMVVITRGERSTMVFRGTASWELTAPRFEDGFREGCGDTMTGAVAAVMARGGPWEEALTTGAAAGAANFLRRGLGSGDAATIAELSKLVTLKRV